MSLFATYHTARRAMAAQASALATTGDNISNAGTEGYARRRVDLRSAPAPGSGFGSVGYPVGGGVVVGGLERLRDEVVATSARKARSQLGAADERARQLGTLEGIFSTTGSGSLGDVLGRFWNAWNDLSQDPESLASRRAVLATAQATVDSLGQMGEGAIRLHEQTLIDLQVGVDDVNSLARELAELNQSVRTAVSTGVPDLASEDRRDVVLTKLSELAPVTFKRQMDGSVTAVLEGMSLVQTDAVTPLKLDTSGTPPRVLFGNSDIALRTTEGRLGARLDVVARHIPEAQQTLDAFARQLVEAVNGQHASGSDQDGVGGGAFFDPAGLTATSIRLAISDPRALAAAALGEPSGDSANATALARLREPIDRAAVDLLAGVGAQVERAHRDHERQAAVVMSLDGIEAGRSAVNMDEELTNMIAQQQSYGAAARLLTTAEQMMQTLLAI
jgi:flagellar hook-associated protein 1 FlgK